MRRVGPEVWSGLAMLVVPLAVAGPILVGAVDVAIHRGWWIALFAAFIATLLLAVADGQPAARRRAAFALAVAASWGMVLTAQSMGLLPVVLVLVAAVSVYVVPLRAGFAVVGLNTVVVLVSAWPDGAPSEVAIITGFYLLIQFSTLLSSVTLLRERRLRREATEAHIDLRAASVLLSESARTSERLRISRDLHDLIGHQLTVLTLELEAARHREGEKAREHVDRANRVARDLLADVRSTVGELRSGAPDLADALGQVVRDLPGLDVTIDAADVQVGEEETAALVRAVQEIVTNTIRHAGARELWIEVVSDESGTVLRAGDDGRGAPHPVPGNGLRGLRERFEALGGEVAFDGADGFRVTARVPAP
ncbi:signal transduction histidine kinase [Murinocardiopsis flavida]|uniref:Signal transduction histidine kinase n=1 Tax=Murinocardiopsis flavida TaxID=645275 RepID=A0A2P8DSN8_9ACTN|nr:histidine kinase [Murinocardiopsis flavida]PSL00233.1 signal transduction histidine kinase [Murinocardiopsis flavida]